MGNPQESLAAYLAGVIDGEGWVGVSVRKTKKGSGMRPTIAVNVVNWDWVEELDRVARELGLPSHVFRSKTSSRWGVYGYKRVLQVIEVIRPYLLNKGRQADLIVELASARDERHWHDGEPTPREWEIVREIRARNDKGKNPQRLHAERFASSRA
jgi:intein/homing endonuclease